MAWSYLPLARQLALNYQMLLPEHPEWLAESVAWADDEALFEATTQFLERVNQYCFPVQTELMQDEVEECAGLLYFAPLQPDGVYLWDDWQMYQEPIPFLCSIYYQAWAHHYAPQYATYEMYPWLTVQDGLDLMGLDDRLNQMVTRRVLSLPPPLDGLPHLIRMITKAWNNFWLDYSVEEFGSGEWVGWDELDVAQLRLEWREAQPVLVQVEALLAWVNKDLRPRLERVADLLNQAHTYQLPAPGDDDKNEAR